MTARASVFALSLATSLAAAAPAAFAAPHTLVIGGDDGYGTSACLADGGACGKVVADALCEQQGFGNAATFRRASAEDITASTGTVPAARDAFVINCAD